MAQVSSGQRIQLLDITRGVAVFGILLANMRFFNTSFQALQWDIELWPAFWDRAVLTFLDIFVTGKFIAIFSFLFGYGMIVLRDRTSAAHRRFVPLYIRRLGALAVFGLLHGWFIWFGDILFHYALLGFALLLFHKRRAGTVLAWAVFLLMLVPTLVLVSGIAAVPPELTPEFEAKVRQLIARDEAAYIGDYATVQRQRLADWTTSAANHLLFYPQILGMFLLGVYFAKVRWLHDAAAHRAVLVKVAWLTGALGLPLNFVVPVLQLAGGKATAILVNQLDVVRILVGAPMMGLFYVTMLALLLGRRPAWTQALEPLARVGRMAFTNYIMQSVVCTWIFYGYGLGWYGKVGPLAGLLLSAAIFSVQIILSSWWLGRFRLGPLEWLWRIITYWSVVPVRKDYAGDPGSASGG